jgi:ribosomal protein S18 acetylase RimI-like enzyme
MWVLTGDDNAAALATYERAGGSAETGQVAVGLHRVDLSVYAFNTRAWHVYEKAGFVTEAIARDALCLDVAWIDAISMSILSTE